MARNVIRCASGMLEWMSSDLSKQFDESDEHPFMLNHVEVLNSIAELDHADVHDKRPICVVTTHASLELGPSRELLSRFASNKYNKVIFTSRPSPGTVAAKLQKNAVTLFALYYFFFPLFSFFY
jgi:predicted metal-dependent RNase